jgi:sugar lactone lactonase YvrE
MKTGRVGLIVSGTSVVLAALLVAAVAVAEQNVVGFESDQWMLVNAEVVDFMERSCLMGQAHLKDVQFENGVIEVDVYVTVDGTRSYPGVDFRIQSDQNYERFYIRPHRANRYPDALQYTPTINGIAGWQLYSGDGFTAPLSIPNDKWLHVKMEISGTQARVFIDNADTPALVIPNLKHGISNGSIGVNGPRNRTTFFSNFSYRIDNTLSFAPPPEPDAPPGILRSWELSQPFKLSQVDFERTPYEQDLAPIKWHGVTSEPSGLVDIGWHTGRTGREPDCVYARTTITSDQDITKELTFGYSDAIVVFLNGNLLFSGNSAYRLRDPSFLGIIGLNDAVYLPLKKGDNELLLLVAESFGGWGFMCQDGTAIYMHEDVSKLWEAVGGFLMPESIVYDPARDALYVSNFDGYGMGSGEGGQFLSEIAPDGTIKNLKWVEGLTNPTGMAMFDGTLFVVERGSVAVVDPGAGTIVTRYPIPRPRFPNDIAIDAFGNMYISDSFKSAIYKCADGVCEEWIVGEGIGRPNGLHIAGNKLLVGNNADNSLKSVDLDTKEITTVATLGSGTIDGIRSARNGVLIVSHSEGKVYRISPAGEVQKMLDTSVPEINSADFEFVERQNMLVIPTLVDNKVMAYQLQ